MRSIGYIFVVLLATPVLGAPTTRPSTAVDPKNCVTSQCHANVKAFAALHGPTANDTCDACHEIVSASEHTYKLTRQNTEMCTYCHEFDISPMPVVHKPALQGQCLGCHDPHGGRDRTFTREKSMQELCQRCHESITGDHKFVHTPVSKGQCDSCHPAHASMYPKLLDAVGNDLCLACHTDFDRKLASVRFQHKALKDGCEKCHDAHASDQPTQLVKSTTDLCFGCHEKTKASLAEVKFGHSAVTSGKACMTCHTPHGSDAISLLNDQPIKLCMDCHNKPVDAGRGKIVPAVAELTDSALHRHGAIKDGQCSGCHIAHGSQHPQLLTRVYETTIYQPFAAANYELCFSCHDVRLVQQESAGGLTQFRNGDRNLHFVHVKEGERGRACAVCHTTHASFNARNIRDSLTFKLWNMPLRFTKTETGGTCAPGCHERWTYDRDHPTTAPTSAPASDWMPTVARSKTTQPVIVTLNTRDVNGQAVKFASDRPRIIVFVRDDPQQSVAVLKQIQASTADQPVDVAVIVSGPLATEQAMALVGKWPIIADFDCKLAGDLNVHGWPLAMVLQSDGLQVARIGGSIESLALKIPPYIALANKTLDQAAIERQLAHPVVVTDEKSPRPDRDLQIARRLLNEKNPAEALKVITRAITVEPKSVALRVELVKTLLLLNRPDDAMTALQPLTEDQLPPGQHRIFRARAMLLLYHWVDAKNLLLETLAKYPDFAEAHYLLGTIYEQDGDLKQALKEYHAADPK